MGGVLLLLSLLVLIVAVAFVWFNNVTEVEVGGSKSSPPRLERRGGLGVQSAAPHIAKIKSVLAGFPPGTFAQIVSTGQGPWVVDDIENQLGPSRDALRPLMASDMSVRTFYWELHSLLTRYRFMHNADSHAELNRMLSEAARNYNYIMKEYSH